MSDLQSQRKRRRFPEAALAELKELASRPIASGAIKRLAERHGVSLATVRGRLDTMRARGEVPDVAPQADRLFLATMRMQSGCGRR